MSTKPFYLDEQKTELNKLFIDRVAVNYEELLDNIQKQVDFYKKEHENLRTEINLVIDENQKLGQKINSINLVASEIDTGESSDDFNLDENHTIINNLTRQIQILKEEKSSIEQLWQTSQKIIVNLERALKAYRKHLIETQPSLDDIKKEYSDALKLLETNIIQLKDKLQIQILLNRKLCEGKIETETKLKSIELKYQNLLNEQKISIKNLKQSEQSLQAAKQKLSEIMKVRLDLENSLDKLNTNNREFSIRENEALQKLQDALQIAESALVEKNEALAREQAVKEECDLLATTIGQVMEEAAMKVDNEMDEIKSQYTERIRNLNTIIDNLKMSLNAQTERTKLAEERSKTLEIQLKNVLKSNMQLDSDLHIASQAIIEMELKLDTLEKLMNKEEETNALCENRAKELQEFLKYNRKLKEKWRETFDEITNKLQMEIQRLTNENYKLENENSLLKAKLGN